MLDKHKMTIAMKPLVQKTALQQELMDYRQLKHEVEEREARLAEFCDAIQDFDLTQETCNQADTREIYCSANRYTPCALLEQAQKESAQLELAVEQMEQARGYVLAQILRDTNNVEEYRAIRWACVDLEEQCLQPPIWNALA